MSKKDYFTCPKCGHSKVEEVLVNVTQYTVINSIDTDGDFKYGKVIAEDGEVQNYQCSKCSYVIYDEQGNKITSQDELVEYLKRIK